MTVQNIQLFVNQQSIQMISVILIIICMCFDVKSHKIPNFCIMLLMFAAIVMVVSTIGVKESFERVISMGIIVMVFYPLFCLRMLGAGDIKFLAVLTMYMYREKVMYFMFFSCMLAAIYALTKMIAQKSLKRRFLYLKNYIKDSIRQGKGKDYYEKEQGYKDVIPMALPIGVSFLLYLGGVY